MSKRRIPAAALATFAALLSISSMCFAQSDSSNRGVHLRSLNAPKKIGTSTALDYTTNWIGNSYGGNDADTQHTMQHVPLDMNGIYATPDGKVYTNTPWEEGGRPVSIFKDGKLISPLDDSNNSPNWSNGGGVAVAADSAHIFRGNGPNGTGVTVLDASTLNQSSMGLSGSSTIDNAHGIFGMAIAKGKLYVTEDDVNMVDVFDLKSLKLVNSFSIPHPVRIAVDSAGGMWVSHRDETPLPSLNGNVYNVNGQMGLPTVDHFDAAGNLVNSITLPDNGEVGALWIEQHGFLLVGDDGPDQNIKVYGNLLHNPSLSLTLGVKGGNLAGKDGDRDGDDDGIKPGRVGPWRFRGITGIATDAQDNIYVSQSGFGMDMGVGHGAILQSYTWWGHENWQVDGLEFVSLGNIDPHSEHDFYDAYHHFKINYDQTGNISRYAADTYDRFKYPDDVRVTSIASTGRIAYIQGRKFLLVGNQGGVYMEMYRFEPGSEIAIPCVAFDYGAFQQQYLDFDVEPLDGEFIWRDMNGDGRMGMAEFTEPASNNSHRDGGTFWVDANGDVWQVNYNSNYEGSIHLRRYTFQGFDSYGAPIYDFSHMTEYSVSPDFPDLADVQRIVFEAHRSEGGTLFVAGSAQSQGAFSKIVRYDNWDKGNRKAKWTIDVPWDPDPNNTWSPNSFSVTGDYVFVDFWVPHFVLVYSVKDGSYVDKFVPGANVGGPQNVGNVDEWQAVSSFRRPNGQYVVVNEEDFQAKFLAYLWKPGALQPPPTPVPPSNVTATGGDEAVTLNWTGGPDALIYNVSRSAAKGGPYTLVDAGVIGTSVTDQGLTNGKTYYYVVSALTETGPSANSTEITAVPVALGTTYEAETSQVTGGGGVYTCPQCSAGARVGAVIPGVALTFSNVNVFATGIYALRVYFTNGDNTPSDFGPLDITVNWSSAGAITAYPYTGDWNIPAFTTINVPLNAGTNTIVLSVSSSITQGAADIDRILVPFNHN